ncbi:MAG: shikimate dehydrogenase [Phycisphaerales bacterium]|nr:shikimate dehydrogenase [Phycisphaerales bacterium]
MRSSAERSPTRLAVPLSSAEPPLAEQVRAARAGGAELIELRVDLIGDVAAVAEVLLPPPAGGFILTIRCAEEGGAWQADDAVRIALYEQLGLHLPGWIDVEFATWQRSANLRQKLGLVCELRHTGGGTGSEWAGQNVGRPKNRLILSHHDFRTTPADLEPLLADLASSPAHVVKAVFTPRDATDALRVLTALSRRGHAARDVTTAGPEWILLAMGEAGLCTRVLARKFDAFLTFAAASEGAESAPGQPTLQTLRHCYRWEELGRRTRVFGVLGWPVRHSRSPTLHNAAMRVAGIDGVYLPFPVQPTEGALFAFLDAATAFEELDAAGFSVTLPHKEHALAWLRARGYGVSALAARCGAVNTLIRDADGGWYGDNTDGCGARDALIANVYGDMESLHGEQVAILGAGGAARAVAVTMLDAGCAVTLYNRSRERAEALAAELGCAAAPWEQRTDADAGLLINCTSVGLWPDVNDTPFPAESLRPGQVVFDTIYHPRETRLLLAARAHGCRVVDGVAMFIGQAAAQFQLWHGQTTSLHTLQALLDSTANPNTPVNPSQ